MSTFGFQGGASGKNPPAKAGDLRDTGSIPGFERSPGGGHGNPPQCPYLQNPMDSGAWWATVHGVINSWTQTERLTLPLFHDPLKDLPDRAPCWPRLRLLEQEEGVRQASLPCAERGLGRSLSSRRLRDLLAAPLGQPAVIRWPRNPGLLWLLTTGFGSVS